MLGKERRLHNDDVTYRNGSPTLETSSGKAIERCSCGLAANALWLAAPQEPSRAVPDAGGRRGPDSAKGAKHAMPSSRWNRDTGHDCKSITWTAFR